MSKISSIPKSEWGTIVTISLTDFFLMMGYALCRPTAEGLFLDIVTNRYQPHCYLAIAIGCALFTALFNYLVKKVDVTRLYAGSALLTGVSLLIFWQLLANPATKFFGAFGLNVWKDIFVVILLEQVWSYCNLVFNKNTATKIYAFFTAIGTTGSLIGNQSVGLINGAKLLNAANMLWFSALAISLSAAIFFCHERGAEKRLSSGGQKLERSSRAGTALVFKSAYLRWMTLLVFSMQMVITMLDFQFKGMVEQNIAGQSAKASFFGSFYFYINLLALLMLVVAPPVLKKLGALKALYISPTILTVAAVAILAAPVFKLICVAMILAKGFDYSLTKTAKEILYIPLSFEEKYKAKSVIDMFVYRVTKGISSGILILFTALGKGPGFMALTAGIITIISLGGWFASLVGLKITQPQAAQNQQ